MTRNAFTAGTKDVNLQDTIFFPAANASVNGNAIDLNQPADYPLTSRLHLRVEWPDLAAHTDPAKAVTVTVQDSADGETFADLNPLPTFSLAGVAVTGLLENSLQTPLPPTTRRYIRAVVTNPAAGPAIADKQLTVGMVAVAP